MNVIKSYPRRNYSKKELEIINSEINKQIVDGISKVQWLMLLAFNETLGIGEQRILKVMDKYIKLLEEYKGYQKDGVADELLSRRLKEILPNSFSKLYE